MASSSDSDTKIVVEVFVEDAGPRNHRKWEETFNDMQK